MHPKSLFLVKIKDNGTQKAVQRQRMGILLCEQNFRDVWRRNKSVRAEICKILRTHTHTRGKISSKDYREANYMYRQHDVILLPMTMHLCMHNMGSRAYTVQKTFHRPMCCQTTSFQIERSFHHKCTAT